MTEDGVFAEADQLPEAFVVDDFAEFLAGPVAGLFTNPSIDLGYWHVKTGHDQLCGYPLEGCSCKAGG